MKGAAERGGGEGPGARARVGDPGAGSAPGAPCWSATLSWWPRGGAARLGPGGALSCGAPQPGRIREGEAGARRVGPSSRPERGLGKREGVGRARERHTATDSAGEQERRPAARRKKRESWRQRGRDRPPSGDRAGGARGRSGKSWTSLVTTEEGDESHEQGEEGGWRPSLSWGSSGFRVAPGLRGGPCPLGTPVRKGFRQSVGESHSPPPFSCSPGLHLRQAPGQQPARWDPQAQLKQESSPTGAGGPGWHPCSFYQRQGLGPWSPRGGTGVQGTRGLP